VLTPLESPLIVWQLERSDLLPTIVGSIPVNRDCRTIMVKKLFIIRTMILVPPWRDNGANEVKD